MTPELEFSITLLTAPSKPHGNAKWWREIRMADTGGRRFRYLRYTAKHGWLDRPYNPWRMTMPEWVVN